MLIMCWYCLVRIQTLPIILTQPSSDSATNNAYQIGCYCYYLFKMLRLFYVNLIVSPISNNNGGHPHKDFKIVKTHVHVTTKHQTQLVGDDTTFIPIMNVSFTHRKFV